MCVCVCAPLSVCVSVPLWCVECCAFCAVFVCRVLRCRDMFFPFGLGRRESVLEAPGLDVRACTHTHTNTHTQTHTHTHRHTHRHTHTQTHTHTDTHTDAHTHTHTHAKTYTRKHAQTATSLPCFPSCKMRRLQVLSSQVTKFELSLQVTGKVVASDEPRKGSLHAPI